MVLEQDQQGEITASLGCLCELPRKVRTPLEFPK
jgi:hypothetical protein